MTTKLWPAAPLAGGSGITLLVTDHAGIADINLRVFEKNGITDVITVVYRGDPDAGIPAGDIIVNAEQALAEGRRRSGANDELALYIAHGLDHLNGADDRTPAERARMRRRERTWLREARRRGLLDRLCSARATRPRRFHLGEDRSSV